MVALGKLGIGWGGLGVTLAWGALGGVLGCDGAREGAGSQPPSGSGAAVATSNVAGVGGQTDAVGAGGGSTSSAGSQAAPVGDGGTDSVAGDAGAAGASSAVVAPPFRSGSRLKARYVDGGGGAQWFTGFFDTELEIECTFRRAADGEIRCLPGEFALTDDFSGRYFADAACSTPVLTNAKLDREFVLLDPDFCPGPGVVEPAARVVATGEAGPPRQVYRRNLENVCVPHDVPQAVVATTEVPPSRFVKATQRPPLDPNAHLQPIQLEGEDGSYEVPGFWDEDRKEPCRLASEGMDAWLPDVCISTRQSQEYESCYADPAKTTPIVGSEPQCRHPSLVESWKADWCMLSQQKSAYAVGELFKDSYAISVDVYCKDLSNVYAPAYRRGAALPWSSFPSLDMVKLGTGRLKLRLGSASGIAAHHYRDAARPDWSGSVVFYDSELDVPCYPSYLPDGERCMPLDTVGNNGDFGTFSDEQCTQPAAWVDAAELSESCEPRRRFFLADPGLGNSVSSGGQARLYEFGTPTTGPSYKKSGTDCVPADWAIAPLIPMSLTDLASVVTVQGMD